jgi:prefoldin subunit 5
MNKAKYYAEKANTTSYAISSDDDDAVEKLKNKLASLEKSQAEMKRINAAYKKTKSFPSKSLPV